MQFLIVILFLLPFSAFGEEELFQPGWSGKYTNAVGYSINFLGGPTFIYDHYLDGKSSETYFFGFQKTASSITTNSTTNNTTIVEVSSGSKSMGTITLGYSRNGRIFRNEWSNIRIGFLGGLIYYSGVDYPTGTKTTTIATGAETFSAFGGVSLKQDPQLLLGPVLYTSFNLRWFPMITVGMDGAIIYSTPTTQIRETTTDTAGVTTVTKSKVLMGEDISMNGNGTFGFLVNFSVRYVW